MENFHDFRRIEPVDAIYLERNVELYKNNPYIEALPPMLERKDVIKMLATFPNYDNNERYLNASERKLMVQNLFEFYYPTERTIEVYEKVSALLSTGYASRNPFSKEFYNQSKTIIRSTSMEYPYEINKTKKGPISNNGLAIVGISGIGKSSAMEQVMSLYPQCLFHSNYKGKVCSLTQLVYLKLECPFDGSIKALCSQFFFELSMLFGKNSYAYHTRADMRTRDYLEKMKLVVHQLGLGMLIIDEVQNLREARGNEREQMLNFFVSLRNELNIPVILIGTPKTYPILQGDFRNIRRGIGQGGIEWGVHDKDNPLWKRLLNGMWRYQWTNVETPLTPELEEALYDESQGITDVLIKLYMMVQIRAMNNKNETITVDLIRKTAKKDFSLIQPMINAIRKTDLEALSRYEDIRPPNIEKLIQQHILESKSKQEALIHQRMLRNLKKQQQKEFKEELFNKLVELNYPKTRSKAAVNYALNELEDNLDVEKGLEIAEKYLEANGGKFRKSKNAATYSNNDLRTSGNEDRVSYDDIKKKGYIPNVNKELGI